MVHGVSRSWVLILYQRGYHSSLDTLSTSDSLIYDFNRGLICHAILHTSSTVSLEKLCRHRSLLTLRITLAANISCHISNNCSNRTYIAISIVFQLSFQTDIHCMQDQDLTGDEDLTELAILSKCLPI